MTQILVWFGLYICPINLNLYIIYGSVKEKAATLMRNCLIFSGGPTRA